MDDYRLLKDLIDKSEYSKETKEFLFSQLIKATSTELLLADLSEKESANLKYQWYTLELDMKRKLPSADIESKGYQLLIMAIDTVFEQTLVKAVMYRPLLNKVST